MEILSLPYEDLPCGISFLHQKSVSETYHIHTHDFYEIFYVIKGRAMHNINGDSECCVSGTLQLIRPADCHNYSFINRYDMELISIGIDRKIMEKIAAFTEINLKEIVAKPMPLSVVFDPAKAENMRHSIKKIGGIENPDRRRSYGKALIATLLYTLTDKTTESVKIPQWLGELITEMNKTENFKVS